MSLPGFPPPNPAPRVTTIAALVGEVDATNDVPVVYAFGGQAPTTIPAEEAAVLTSDPANATRMFVEFEPYGD